MDRRKRPEKRKFQAEKYKKFIGSRQEGQGFADKRKKKIQYEYLKMLKKEKRKQEKSHSSFIVDSDTEEKNDDNQKKKTSDKHSKLNTYSKPQKQYSKKKEEKERMKKEASQNKKKIESALAQYKNKKSKQYKLLCKRTYKGQPVMKNQIDLLLQKIQSDINQT